MYDINFYRYFFSFPPKTVEEVNELRSKTPVVFGIETTNNCNKKCSFCPRGRGEMTRPVITSKVKSLEKIIPHIRPWNKEEIEKWERFVENKYHISKDDMGENHFYLYILPRVLVLHGWGEPALDKHLEQKVKRLSSAGFETYFSCNPENLHPARAEMLCADGLSYIKFSIDSTSKNIRGGRKTRNFVETVYSIINLKNYIERNKLKTKIIITMINLEQAEEEWALLPEYFRKEDGYYVYRKSLNSQAKSIHWSQLCFSPWYGCSIHSNDNVVLCNEDFDDSMVLGNLNDNNLFDIWNGTIAEEYRKKHHNDTCEYCKVKCEIKTLGRTQK